jgi:hypothetical protein
VPTLVQKTRPWSRHSAAAAARSAVCRVWSFRSAAAAWSGSFSVRRDFSVFVFPALPDRTPDVDRELLVAEADVSDWPPGQLREQLVPLPTARQVDVAARFRPGDLTSPAGGTKAAMATGARRHEALSAEISTLDTALAELVTSTAPSR